MASASSRWSWTASSWGPARRRPAHLAVADAEVVQRAGEVGQVGGAGLGQFPVELDGFLGGRQRVGPPAHLAVAGCRGCSARGEVGQVGPGWRGEFAVDGTASSAAGSASAGRPSSAVALPRLLRPRRVGQGGPVAVASPRYKREAPLQLAAESLSGTPTHLACAGHRGCSARWRDQAENQCTACASSR